MSKVDATEALRLYRQFCKQTERVVEFLGVAKKLQNLLNVSVPNLRHVGLLPPTAKLSSNPWSQAPVSLLKSLEEYLNDPHFEQNRIEYKASKVAVDKSMRNGGKSRGVTKKLDDPSESVSVSSAAVLLMICRRAEGTCPQWLPTEYFEYAP